MNLKGLSARKMGRPPATPGDTQEVAKVIEFFKERRITALAISHVIDVSVTITYRWWRTGVIPDYRLAKLQELVEQINIWEKQNNKKFNPKQDSL
jgi:hypothetical protein